jgi:uncharacterized membrane protein YvbJ
MQCENCGASLTEGASICPECGEPVSADAGTTVTPAPAPAAALPKSRRSWVVAAVAVVAVVVIAIGGYLVIKQASSGTGPEGAALRMMNAFALYDAQGILDNATHASLNTTDQATFSKQAADSKKNNKGLPAVKNIKVTKVTQASQDATTATVQLSAQWLTDAAKSTYTARTETLTVIKQDGKWVVRLFQ